MKKQTVTIDTSRLVAAAEKAIKACQEFTKACEAFGSDPRDVVVSTMSEDEIDWEKALVRTVTDEGGHETISFDRWYPIDWCMIPLSARDSLTSYGGIAVVGRFGFKRKSAIPEPCIHDWFTKRLGSHFIYFKCRKCGNKTTSR
jgi:hypothetical protein